MQEPRRKDTGRGNRRRGMVSGAEKGELGSGRNANIHTGGGKRKCESKQTKKSGLSRKTGISRIRKYSEGKARQR